MVARVFDSAINSVLDIVVLLGAWALAIIIVFWPFAIPILLLHAFFTATKR